MPAIPDNPTPKMGQRKIPVDLDDTEKSLLLNILEDWALDEDIIIENPSFQDICYEQMEMVKSGELTHDVLWGIMNTIESEKEIEEENLERAKSIARIITKLEMSRRSCLS